MGEIRLYTYAVSQASEKIRWALDLARIPYRECRLTPFVHAGEMFRSMPVLEADGESIVDSTRILDWLEAKRAPFPLIPRDPMVRATVMSAEARFDQAGVHLLRWVYAELLRNPELALRLWSMDANVVQRLALRAGFPLIRRLFARGVGFDDAQMARSKRIIDRSISELDRLAESGQTFSGMAISAADITAAALFAPIACPDQHPIYGCADYRGAMKAVAVPWQGRPGLDWVRGLYREYRCATLKEVVEPSPMQALLPGLSPGPGACRNAPLPID